MDYREFGLHVDDRGDASAASDAEPGDQAAERSGVPGADRPIEQTGGQPHEHPGDRQPRKVLIDAEDLQAIDYDAIAHPRELNRLRDEITRLRDELTAARASRAATAPRQQALGAEPPPF